ncbi:MAG: hypothetical protein PWP60_1416 [Candidatus Atribacteria bacterium]|jgi:hypothetical protein|nr:hypothetical protein [Candidatus Atribacteria bacterium]
MMRIFTLLAFLTPFVLLLTLAIGSTLAQELLLEKPGERRLFVLPDCQVLCEEAFEVNLRPGENSFSWQKPKEVSPQEIHFSAEAAELTSITYPENSTLAVLSINSEEAKKATLKALYPLQNFEAEFLYQVVWEKGVQTPHLYLYLLLSGNETPASQEVVIQVLGQSYSLHLEPGVPQQLLLAEKEVQGEKFIRYLSGQAQALHFWKLEIPRNLQVKGKVECFEKRGENLTFLGEGHLTGKEDSPELLLGSAESVIVEETLTLREKSNRFYSESGEEVLYDTVEEKVYRIENRGEEKAKIQIYQSVHPSSQVVSASHPVKVEEARLLSITLELEAQQKREVKLKIQGEKLTWGWAFES